jgi:hypothetical protein
MNSTTKAANQKQNADISVHFYKQACTYTSRCTRERLVSAVLMGANTNVHVPPFPSTRIWLIAFAELTPRARQVKYSAPCLALTHTLLVVPVPVASNPKSMRIQRPVPCFAFRVSLTQLNISMAELSVRIQR